MMEKVNPMYDTYLRGIVAIAQAEGRVNGQYECEVCGMLSNDPDHPETCCKPGLRDCEVVRDMSIRTGKPMDECFPIWLLHNRVPTRAIVTNKAVLAEAVERALDGEFCGMPKRTVCREFGLEDTVISKITCHKQGGFGKDVYYKLADMLGEAPPGVAPPPHWKRSG